MRCPWPRDDAQMLAYHDQEWGVPVFDDKKLFGKLILDGFQAGLSWQIILRKRDNFLRAFDGFDPEKMARYRQPRIEKLMNDAGIIRNRQKIVAAVQSARAFVGLRDSDVDFSDFLWSFTGGAPKVNTWKRVGQVPAETKESVAMSKALRERGFNFCGPTICYAFMQAVGMVNDHLVTCFRHSELSRSKVRP
jgi:DNA-3-methyladenine glycosylase I